MKNTSVVSDIKTIVLGSSAAGAFLLALVAI